MHDDATMTDATTTDATTTDETMIDETTTDETTTDATTTDKTTFESESTERGSGAGFEGTKDVAFDEAAARASARCSTSRWRVPRVSTVLRGTSSSISVLSGHGRWTSSKTTFASCATPACESLMRARSTSTTTARAWPTSSTRSQSAAARTEARTLRRATAI